MSSSSFKVLSSCPTALKSTQNVRKKIPAQFQPDPPQPTCQPSPSRVQLPTDPLQITPSHSIPPPFTKKTLPDVWHVPLDSFFWAAMSLEPAAARSPGPAPSPAPYAEHSSPAPWREEQLPVLLSCPAHHCLPLFEDCREFTGGTGRGSERKVNEVYGVDQIYQGVYEALRGEQRANGQHLFQIRIVPREPWKKSPKCFSHTLIYR